jgi:hypothetical protein
MGVMRATSVEPPGNFSAWPRRPFALAAADDRDQCVPANPSFGCHFTNFTRFRERSIDAAPDTGGTIRSGADATAIAPV